MDPHDARKRLLVDVWDAGTATGTSYRTVRRMVARGDLINYGGPRRIRVDLDEAINVLGDPRMLRTDLRPDLLSRNL